MFCHLIKKYTLMTQFFSFSLCPHFIFPSLRENLVRFWNFLFFFCLRNFVACPEVLFLLTRIFLIFIAYAESYEYRIHTSTKLRLRQKVVFVPPTDFTCFRFSYKLLLIEKKVMWRNLKILCFFFSFHGKEDVNINYKCFKHWWWQLFITLSSEKHP